MPPRTAAVFFHDGAELLAHIDLGFGLTLGSVERAAGEIELFLDLLLLFGVHGQLL
jgi:hypothetical protein